jgi:hypothetical protein
MKTSAQSMVLLSLLAACAGGQWESKQAKHPATRSELAAYRVTVVAAEPLGDELRQALAQEGFQVVAHPPLHEDLQLRAAGGLAVLTSDDFFVDQVPIADPAGAARSLASSRRVRDFIRNSGTVEQRDISE